MIQKTFWCLLGDLLKKEGEINDWLARKKEQGFSLFSRDQIDMRHNGVYITYTMVDENPSLKGGE